MSSYHDGYSRERIGRHAGRALTQSPYRVVSIGGVAESTAKRKELSVTGYKVEQFGKARCRAAQSATATGRLDCPHAAHGRRDVAQPLDRTARRCHRRDSPRYEL